MPKAKSISSARKLWNTVTQGMETVLIRHGKHVYELPLKDLSGETNWKLCNCAAEHAIFSALVYHEFDSTESIPGDLYPETILNDVLSEWTFVPQDADALNLSRANTKRKLISGLKYNFWHSSVHNEFVIAFRGTSSKSDWWANARWITRLIPGIDDHYDIVQQGMPSLVKQIRNQFGDSVKISVTGHSLGGGLAQQAAYAVSGIENVTVFNSTPVTGYYEIDKAKREEHAKGLKIVRIFEHGEVLAYLRLPLRVFYWLSESNPEIHELRFNLLKRQNLISEHSMKEFSRFIYEKLNIRKTEPEPPKPELLTEEA